MEKRNTKELILRESLKLFSKRGYDGVSVRDIAKAVGIRESALYKHFSNKQEIFDVIIERMISKYNEASVNFNQPQGDDFANLANTYSKNGIETLKTICTSIFLYWLNDEEASMFRRLLYIEQVKNTVAGTTFKEVFIKSPIEYQTKLFTEMIKIGYFIKTDPKIMALEFYSPIFLLLNLYDNNSKKEKEALDFIEKHVTQFDNLYRRK